MKRNQMISAEGRFIFHIRQQDRDRKNQLFFIFVCKTGVLLTKTQLSATFCMIRRVYSGAPPCPSGPLAEIKKGLEEKLEAMVKRDLYTKYKTAPTEEERENARQEYLEKVGMHRSFRW